MGVNWLDVSNTPQSPIVLSRSDPNNVHPLQMMECWQYFTGALGAGSKLVKTAQNIVNSRFRNDHELILPEHIWILPQRNFDRDKYNLEISF